MLRPRSRRPKRPHRGIQPWPYWNEGPRPGGDVWLTTDEREWSIATGRTAAANLLAVAQALQSRPLPAPKG
jgi:hypothetical protein